MGRCAFLVACAVLVASACDDDSTVPAADLGVTIPDLSTNDLALVGDLTFFRDLATCTPPTPRDGFASSADAAGFCDGTTIAGTCAQAFFARFAACFFPAGCRVYSQGVPPKYTTVSWYWASGAGVSLDHISGSRGYDGNSAYCAMANDDYNIARDDYWTLADGTTLTINWTSGAVTCPDGSHIQISAPRSCTDLDALVDLPPAVTDPGCCLP